MRVASPRRALYWAIDQGDKERTFDNYANALVAWDEIPRQGVRAVLLRKDKNDPHYSISLGSKPIDMNGDD